MNKVYVKLIYLVYYGFDFFQSFIGKPLLEGYNIAIKKNAYEKIGGFNTQLFAADDWDISMCLYKEFGSKAVRYVFGLKVIVSVRKLNTFNVSLKYNLDMIMNYINMVILEKRKVRSVFNVR